MRGEEPGRRAGLTVSWARALRGGFQDLEPVSELI